VRISELASQLGADAITVCEVAGRNLQPRSFIDRQQEGMLRAVWTEFPADRPMTVRAAATALHVDVKYALRHVSKHAGPDSLLTGTSVRRIYFRVLCGVAESMQQLGRALQMSRRCECGVTIEVASRFCEKCQTRKVAQSMGQLGKGLWGRCARCAAWTGPCAACYARRPRRQTCPAGGPAHTEEPCAYCWRHGYGPFVEALVVALRAVPCSAPGCTRLADPVLLPVYPLCDAHRAQLSAYKISVSTKIERITTAAHCTSRCWDAHEPVCACSCGGENHSRDYRRHLLTCVGLDEVRVRAVLPWA
jgi:hypothetical protein